MKNMNGKNSGWIKTVCAFVLLALLWVGLTAVLPQAQAEGTHSVTLDRDEIINDEGTILGSIEFTDDFQTQYDYDYDSIPEGTIVTFYVSETSYYDRYSLDVEKPEYYYSELFNIVITARTSTKEIEISRDGNIYYFIMPDEDVFVHGEYVFHSFCCRTRKGRCPCSDDYFHHFVLTDAAIWDTNDTVQCQCVACEATLTLRATDVALAHYVDMWRYDNMKYDWGICYYCHRVVQKEHEGCIHEWGLMDVDWASDYSMAMFHIQCPLCDEFIDIEVRDIQYEGTDPTCTESGSGLLTARYNMEGDEFTSSVSVEILPIGHSLYWSDRLENNYKEDGHVEGWTCKNCGRHFRDEEGNEEIPADEWILPKNCPFSGSGTESDPWQIDAPFIAQVSGWYEMIADVTLSERISVTGDVNLILGEGTTLTAPQGISVYPGNFLTISGSGNLIANASGVESAAGIGGIYNGGNRYSGDITIHSGTVIATGGKYGAGIGGGMYGGTGVITINGGNVTATGGTRAAGIGGGGNNNWKGSYGHAGTITINGGVVTATGNGTGSGIGAGGGTDTTGGGTVQGGRVEAVVINGGQVTATSPTGAGIGPEPWNGTGSVVLGWSAESDFIEASSCSGTVSFREGKTFVLDGTNIIATLENMNGMRLVPFNTDFGDAALILPADMLVIEDNAFEGDQSIVSVEVQANCERIGKEAFKDCLYLEKIRIPAGCTVGEDAFAGCDWVLVYGTENSSAWEYCQAHPENTQFMPDT